MADPSVPNPNVVEWHYLWLRVIAHAWQQQDADFRDKLVTDSQNEDERNAAAKKAIDEVPPDGDLIRSMRWPLPSFVRLRVRTKDDSVWMPDPGIWSMPPTELEIQLPLPPTSGNVAKILSQYSETLSTLGRVSHGIGTKARESNEEDVKTTNVSENIQTAFEQYIRWFTVWPCVVARAWREDNAGTRTLRNLLDNDAGLALKNVFGFELPSGVHLTVKSLGSNFNPDPDKLPLLIVTMIFPSRPALAEQPVALSVYADSGRTVPFTLCAVLC